MSVSLARTSLGIRKLSLTAHVAKSVGWFGAVAAFLVLAVVRLSSAEAAMARGAYIAMAAIPWAVFVLHSWAARPCGAQVAWPREHVAQLP